MSNRGRRVFCPTQHRNTQKVRDSVELRFPWISNRVFIKHFPDRIPESSCNQLHCLSSPRPPLQQSLQRAGIVLTEGGEWSRLPPRGTARADSSPTKGKTVPPALVPPFQWTSLHSSVTEEWQLLLLHIPVTNGHLVSPRKLHTWVWFS